MAQVLVHRAEKSQIGRELSAALVATLVGLTLSNVGIMSCEAPQYGVVNSYLLPLAIPMLLLSANMRDVLSDTGAVHHSHDRAQYLHRSCRHACTITRHVLKANVQLHALDSSGSIQLRLIACR